MSLRRAFRIPGAETVLASHWEVSDEATNALMTEFVRRWRAGDQRAHAWREAQLTLLRSKDFSNPFFWSAFTLTGEWRLFQRTSDRAGAGSDNHAAAERLRGGYCTTAKAN